MSETLNSLEVLEPSEAAVADTRRRLLRGLGMVGVTAGAGLLAACAGGINNIPPVDNSPLTDANILNFALNLEYLEAEFYTVATTGKTIDQIGIGVSGTGTQGSTTGGKQVAFSDTRLQAVAQELAFDEQAHVRLLRGALGSSSVARPAINLNALGIGFNSETEFLTLARAFEDVGVTAYGGAAPLLQSKAYLGVAAQILAAEALHSGDIRLLVVQRKISVGALDSFDVPPTSSSYFPVDGNALAMIRTPRQVLDVVYGAVGAAQGGFFPNGMNGRINK